jgi:hypothetical protein
VEAELGTGPGHVAHQRQGHARRMRRRSASVNASRPDPSTAGVRTG